MSSKIKGLRRVGIVGLSTAVVASMMTLTAATSFAAAGDFTAVDQLDVSQGQLAAPAGDLTLEFANNFGSVAEQTFTIVGNDCTTAAGIAAAVEFSGTPTVAVTDPGTANAAADRTPILSPAVVGSSNTTCAAVGITDRVTLTQTLPALGTTTDTWLATLSNIKYNIGASKTATAINVVTAGGLVTGPATVSNAIIPVVSIFNTPARVAALSTAPGVTSLGKQTLSEGAAGAFFSGTKVITLSLSTGNFTAGITPTITVPAGYSVTPVAAPTTFSGLYSFTVVAPTATVRAVVTVSGLTTTPTAGVKIVSLAASNATTSLDVKVINVVDYGQRTGGALRYDTAAALFDSAVTTVDDVVLSGGALFPDALSANYLAGQLNTGTLLTPPNSLSSAARAQIFKAGVKTVYITGGFGAVSKAVENTIEALHVGNSPTAPFITTIRLGGATRYDTNMLINEHSFKTSNTVLLASGGGFSLTQGFADALALGPVAYKGATTASATDGYPLILTRGATLGTTENSQLSDFNPTNVIIAGGTGVVSAAIETSLKTRGYNVLRLAGQDRTQTAAAIAGWATEGISTAAAGSFARLGGGFLSNRTFITTGTGFADALAAGPVAGLSNQLILLSSSPTVLGLGIPAYLGGKTVGGSPDNTAVFQLWALGLTGATSNPLMAAAAATIEIP